MSGQNWPSKTQEERIAWMNAMFGGRWVHTGADPDGTEHFRDTQPLWGMRPDASPWMNGALFLLNLGVWWMYRNEGDDDFRKRQKRRAAEKVATLGHRLVVVPAGTS